MGAAEQVRVDEGTVVDGRYRLDLRLGEGTFGSVWRAHDLRLSYRAVAVKLLKAEFLEQPAAVARFDAEADALARLSHPNIVAVLDRGTWGGQRFIVTELVEGTTLSAYLQDHRARGALPEWGRALELFDQVCAAVEAAHRVRTPGAIVHRDLKPDNVLLGVMPDGVRVVKLIDFGIAQLGQRGGTQSGVSLGTPLYMAPEQAYGHVAGVGPWTDVFALGVILSEMLTLCPQPSETEPWWLPAVRGHDPRPILARRRPDIDPAVWAVVARCLRSEGADRYPDAGALRDALRGLGGAGRPSAVGGATVPTGGPLSAGIDSAETRASTLPGDASLVSAMSREGPGPGAPAPGGEEVQAGAEAEAPGAPAVMPWGRMVLGVIVVAVLLAASIVLTLVRVDGMRRTAPTGRSGSPGRAAQASPRTVAGAGAGSHPVAAFGDLLGFLRRWEGAVTRRPGAEALVRVYAPSVRWHGSQGVRDPGAVGEQIDRNLSRGGSLRLDWTRSVWSWEPVDGPDVAEPCRQVAGATGAVVKVRAWAEEVRPERVEAIGCPRLEGRYLLRLRDTPTGMRVCHESWSIEEGICASCPTAPMCRGRGGG